MIYQTLCSFNDFLWSALFLPCTVICGGLLSFRCGFLQLRRFPLAMKLTVGSIFQKRRAEKGAVTPFQAAATALASTVGTGNIIGTAQAIAMGGPGAVFWMWAASLLGMIIKYAEICLSILYRRREAAGGYSGGPMVYIELGLGRRFQPLAKAYALLASLAAFGIGNMSQISSAAGAVTQAAEFFGLRPGNEALFRHALGLILASLTCAAVFRGTVGTGKLTAVLVPLMSAFFFLAAGGLILCHAQKLPAMLHEIFRGAFSPKAIGGGMSGAAMRQALQWGLRRSAFSNEAGLGSAAIAHASADVRSAPDQGLWGIFEVFADTVVICSLTAFAILCSGIHVPWGQTVGGELFTAALASVYGKGCSQLFMALSLLLFAMSSVLGWALYGSCCVKYLFGSAAMALYRVLFSAAVYLSWIMSTELIWALADCFNALMSVPNFIALFALSGQVAEVTRERFSS